MSKKINTPCGEITQFHTQWRTIRDMLAGSFTIKQRGDTYLPKAAADQSPEAYAIYKDEVTFHPATGSTLAGLCGLVLAKPPTLKGPKFLKDIEDEITFDAESFQDLGEAALYETFAVNYGGILVDYPAGEKPAIEADAIEQGFRPYAARYAAEKIVRVERERVANRNKLTYVELEDDDCTRRVLKLVDGIYTVEIWQRNSAVGLFVLASTHVPAREDGQRLTMIPFEILTDDPGAIYPRVSTIEPVAQLNLDHYRIEGRISYIHYWQSMAILYTAGANPAEPEKDADGKDILPPPFKVGGPEAWMLSDPSGKVAYAEFSGAGVQSLERKRDKIEQRMAIIGAQILQQDKAAAEAAETVAMRTAARYSTLARTARVTSRKLTNVARWIVWWMGGTLEEEKQTSFTFNTDYRINTLTDGVIDRLSEQNAAGKLSDETLFYLFQKGGLYPEGMTFWEEKKRIQEEGLDTPTAAFDLDEEDSAGDDAE